eukprot:2520799-Pyramimonas_sp.AAC.1
MPRKTKYFRRRASESLNVWVSTDDGRAPFLSPNKDGRNSVLYGVLSKKGRTLLEVPLARCAPRISREPSQHGLQSTPHEGRMGSTIR